MWKVIFVVPVYTNALLSCAFTWQVIKWQSNIGLDMTSNTKRNIFLKERASHCPLYEKLNKSKLYHMIKHAKYLRIFPLKYFSTYFFRCLQFLSRLSFLFTYWLSCVINTYLSRISAFSKIKVSKCKHCVENITIPLRRNSQLTARQLGDLSQCLHTGVRSEYDK